MKRALRTTTILFIVASCVLFVFLETFLSPTYATLPSGYESAVGDGEWYFGEDYLNLAQLKSIVKGWFEDDRVYDFSYLETHPIVVAVIDTGVNFDHELFDGFYDADGHPIEDDGSVAPYDVFYRDENGDIICKNTVKESGHISTSIFDDAPDKHGTHVTGIVATLIHALDLEKYIKILPIKAAYPKGSSSSFSEEALKSALEFAVSNGAHVINMSLSSSSVSFGSAVTNDIANSAVCIAAAGNDGKASEGSIGSAKFYPAAAANVIGVMNLTHGLLGYGVYSSSNYGNAYDIGAPGYAIWSANGATEDEYKTLNGTSMASPFVAFGAALATLKYSALAKATGSVNAKTPRQIASIIRGAHSTSVLYKSKNINVFDMTVFAKDEGIYSLVVNCNESDLTQRLGEVKEIRFEADLLPSNEQNATLVEDVKWYKQNADATLEELGQGKAFVYTPANLVGTTTIVAKYDGEHSLSASKTVTVEYKKPSKEDTQIVEDKPIEKYEIGETYKFEIKDAKDYVATDVVIWYVNGEYAHNGFTFEFSPETVGEYTISCKINGIVLDDAVTLKVGEQESVIKQINTYVSVGMASALVLVGVVVAIVCCTKQKAVEK